MKSIAALIIAMAVATPALAQVQQQIPAPIVFSIRSGETMPLRLFTSVTNDCAPTFKSFTALDVLEGPPEITLTFNAQMVNVNTIAGKVCAPVNGGIIMISAKDVTESKEAKLTFRVRYKANFSDNATTTYRYHVLMFPGEQK